MKKIENYEEKINLLNQTYYDNYLFMLERDNPKFLKKIMEECTIFQTNDDYYIVINIDKPSIDRDLWFDDEQPIPEKTEQLFIDYNIRMNAGRLKSTATAKDGLFIYNPYHGTLKNNLVITSGIDRSLRIDNGTYKRELQEDEKSFIQEIYNTLLDGYIERLKKYYKRYNEKIHCRGYWVNR